MTTRRSLIAQLPAAAVAGSFALRLRTVFAADKRVTVGITVPLTGSDNEQATLIKEGAMMAVDEANAKGGVAGYEINALVLDNGTATAGAGGDQRSQNGRRPECRGRSWAAKQRVWQSDGSDPQPGQSGNDYPILNQSRHHRSKIRRPVSTDGQIDLFPYCDD